MKNQNSVLSKPQNTLKYFLWLCKTQAGGLAIRRDIEHVPYKTCPKHKSGYWYPAALYSSYAKSRRFGMLSKRPSESMDPTPFHFF